jgi:HK97 family phage major capsid protein
MRDRISELQARLDALRSEIDELDALESPTDEQTARFGVALDEAEQVKVEYDAEVARQARVENVRAINIGAVEGKRESGFSAPDVHVRTKRSAFDNLDGVRAGLVSADDMVARALNAIEEAPEYLSAAGREAATVLAEVDPRIARHILLTGSPEYHAAFRAYLRNPRSEQARASMTTTDANGGYLIPFTLDPTIVLTSDGSSNPFRMISRIEKTATNDWNGVTSAGVTAEWLAESSQAADASPTTGAITIPTVKGFASVNASFELAGDSNIAAQLPRLFQDAKDNLEATAFATGAGSTTAPKGIVTAVTAVTSSRVTPTTGGVFSAATDVYALQAAVPPRHRSNSSWVANFSILSKIRQFDTSGGSSFWANLGAGTPEQLLGRPVYESSAMSSSVTTGSNILIAGNFQEFVIVDRVGMSVLYDDNIKGANQRPTGEVQWACFWRVGSDVATANAFRVLKL